MNIEKSFYRRLLDAPTAITFNDVILLPGYTRVEPREVDLRTRVTANHVINLPFVSSPMDTVTGAEMAIALARLGGVGILHRNCSAEEQLAMARKVKRAESFIIRDVITISPDQQVSEAIRIMEDNDIHGLPVVDDRNYLVGIVTWRDVRYSDPSNLVRDVMTGKDRLVYSHESITIEEAKRLMNEYRVEKLPIVDKDGRLLGLVTFKDLQLRGKFPDASRDADGRLLVGAAVSPYDLDRAKMLDRYVDIIVIDVAHFHNENVISSTRKLMNEVSADVVVGNIGTREAALDIVSRLDGVAGFRVGIGSGSICKTGVVTRVAAPTLFAVASVADALASEGLLGKLPIIADGGIKNSGDIALALATGASAVMMGNLLAGTRESPGRLVALEGKYYKEYYGMGSNKARMKRASLDRYSKPSKDVEEGVEGWVPYRGTVKDVVQELKAGVEAAMGYVGASNIEELWYKARFALVSPSGMGEIRPHNIFMIKG